MRASLNWIREYVAVTAGPDEVARRLTMAGLEVEGVERPGEGLRGVVVAEIKEAAKHPNADKLSVTQVDAGTGALLQVVCGAKNFKVGDKVPLATVGTKLPDGTQIKAAQLRGTDSFGMLCSSKELALSKESDGLLILSTDAKVGTPIAAHLGLDDALFEINVTANRPDALSHLGLAREVATLFGLEAKAPKATVRESPEPASGRIKVRIEDGRCVRYAAKVLEGLTVGPSPSWLSRRLEACGVRSINNIVDVTNYVMLEYGQPLHAFDLDRVGGQTIVVRGAKAGEVMTTLDGKARTLDAEDLLVCDAAKPQVLAGVMGGADSEVSEKTTRVLLECASFLPATVRRSARRHALHSESSHRFERGVDTGSILQVIERAASLLCEVGGGVALAGTVDVYPKPSDKRRVTLRQARLASVLGVEVPLAEVVGVLTRLGFVQVTSDAQGTTWEVPGARVDVAIEEDLIEEIARIRGFEAIPARLPSGGGQLKPASLERSVEARIRAALQGAGLTEVVSYSFVAPSELKAFEEDRGVILVQNPLSLEQSAMRTTLLPSLVQTVARSARHQASGMRAYEIAKTYRMATESGGVHAAAADERLCVGGVLWGQRDGKRTWTQKETAVDFYDAKAAVESMLDALGIRGAQFVSVESPWYHPRASAQIRLGDVVVGSVGEIHPIAAKRLDAPSGIFGFQLEFAPLCAAAQLVPAATGLGRFPSVFRDIAVVVPAGLSHDEIRRVMLDVGKPLVEDATIFDVYTGSPIPDGQKNVAFALRYRSNERTLTDADVNEAHAKIVAEVSAKLGASLRG